MKWEQNHPLKWVRFFSIYPMSANCGHAKKSRVPVSDQRIVANLP